MKSTIYCFISFLFISGTLMANPVLKKKTARLFVSHYENVLGTSMELKLSAYSEKNASIAEMAVLTEIKRVSKLLSTYDPQSEFSSWLQTKNTPVPVSPELFEVLSLFDAWRMKTNGALDASAQVISKLWKKASGKQELPSKEALASAVAEVQQAHWQLDSKNKTATHLSNTPLVLNSFAKTYIIKRAVDAAMASANLNSIVVNIGGDMVIAGNVNETVQISDPKADAENDAPIDILQVSNRAVATSGNYRRGELINGQWYSHIVDPRTGLPADEVISATVVAPNATDAGALATSFNVLTPSESIQLAANIPGVDYLLITKNGERIESKGWSELKAPATNNEKLAKTADGWNNGFELAINLEVSTIAEQFSHRPFVAIWVEDKDKNPIRTVSLWYNKPKWLHDLREWYRIFGQSMMTDYTQFSSSTSATRSPGKYLIKWDGKDDKGNYVKPGKYTVYIEAAREHGTYQLIKQELECNESPKLINLTGNVEIASASLEYRKKTNN